MTALLTQLSLEGLQYLPLDLPEIKWTPAIQALLAPQSLWEPSNDCGREGASCSCVGSIRSTALFRWTWRPAALTSTMKLASLFEINSVAPRGIRS